MRNILIIVTIAIVFFSCKNKPRDYATLTGIIINPKSDSLVITDGRTYQKIISIKEDGSFGDTLKVVAGDYRFSYGDDYGVIYLKNDNVSSFTFDYEDFYNTLVYSGDDADINNFAIQNYQLINQYFSPDMAFDATREDIDSSVYKYKLEYENLKSKFKNLDSLHIANSNIIVDRSIKSVEFLYASKLALDSILPKGSPSPDFVNYENYNGNSTSLSDLKGKNVYIVFWASWHSATKKYLPAYFELEQQYKDKNIVFVCISLDDERTSGSMEKAREAWRKYVTNNKELTGVQLIADKGWNSELVAQYQIKAIPRFVLIDGDGNIISPDAPSPSNPKLIELFDTLGI